MSNVVLETRGAVVTVTLNNPAMLNALDVAMAEELLTAVNRISEHRDQYRCLVLTGAGRGFCSGGSMGLIAGDGSGNREQAAHGVTLGSHHHHIMKTLRDLPFPIITAVNGPAAGLGFSYALCGDLVVAARSAFFLSAFRRIGVSPDGGLSWLLPRIIGWARAKELMVLGNRLPAEQALEWGLINRVFDDDRFTAETAKLADELADGPTVALAVTRKLFWESWEQGYAAQLDLEETLQPITFATRDAAEGGRAMVEKRTPKFVGS